MGLFAFLVISLVILFLSIILSFIMGTFSHYEFESNGYIYTGFASKPENINIDDSVYITFLPDKPGTNNLSINLK